MIEPLATLLYFAGILAAGDVVVRFLPGRPPGGAIERLSATYLAGCGVVAVLLLDAQIAGIPTESGLVLGIVGVAAAAAGISRLRARGRGDGPRESPTLERRARRATEPRVREARGTRVLVATCIAVIAIGFVASTVFRMSLPYSGDAVKFWELKGSILFHEGLRSDAFLRADRVHFHKGYPIGVPLLEAGLHAMRGTSQGVAVRWLFAGFHLALLGMLFGEARRRLARGHAWLATGLLAAAPLFVLDAVEAHVDLPLGAFHLAMAVYLLRWIDDARPAHLVAGVVAGVFAALTKQEGLAYLAVGIAVAAGTCLVRWRRDARARVEGDDLPGGRARSDRVRRLVSLLVAVGVAAVLLAPWILFERTLPRQDENYVSRFSIDLVSRNLDRVPTILGFYGIEALNVARWGPVWILIFGAAGTAVVRMRRVTVPWAALAILTGALGSVTVAYVLAPAHLEWLLVVSLWRLYLHSVGIGMLAAIAVVMPVASEPAPAPRR